MGTFDKENEPRVKVLAELDPKYWTVQVALGSVRLGYAMPTALTVSLGAASSIAVFVSVALLGTLSDFAAPLPFYVALVAASGLAGLTFGGVANKGRRLMTLTPTSLTMTRLFARWHRREWSVAIQEIDRVSVVPDSVFGTAAVHRSVELV